MQLPTGYSWRTIEPCKAVLQHDESGKSYGVRGFGPTPVLESCGAKQEIAYGIAKIERELERDRRFAAGIK
jgi:hypothetical protein